MKRFITIALTFVLLIGGHVFAQEKKEKHEMKEMADGQDEFVKDAVAQFHGLGEKFAALAKAVPKEKLTWSPGEGVRSIREVFTHAADANILFITMAGVKAPSGPALSKNQKERENRFTTNEELMKAITESFAYVEAQVATMTHDQLHAKTKMFGQETTNMNVILVSIGHLHEHLGQSIAYARTNGVVPSWNAN